MGFYTKKIEKIVAKTSNVGWRYRHAKTFDQALNLFVDFIIDRLQDLGSFEIEVAAGVRDVTPELQDELLVQIRHFFLEAKHTMANIVQEFSALLETYDIVIPINEEAYLALQAVLKSREKDILKEIKAIHAKVLDLENRAKHTGLVHDADYKKEIPLLSALKQFSLAELSSMFKSGTVPHVFSLLGDENGDDLA